LTTITYKLTSNRTSYWPSSRNK